MDCKKHTGVFSKRQGKDRVGEEKGTKIISTTVTNHSTISKWSNIAQLFVGQINNRIVFVKPYCLRSITIYNVRNKNMVVMLNFFLFTATNLKKMLHDIEL